ncbi:hypothetical protein NHP21005_16550 [Helicobacter sp. NHP21005]|nr:hypothetical protein NHP21005_16550 [Helicobacter sp. NHP21005]
MRALDTVWATSWVLSVWQGLSFVSWKNAARFFGKEVGNSLERRNPYEIVNNPRGDKHVAFDKAVFVPTPLYQPTLRGFARKGGPTTGVVVSNFLKI